MPNRNDVEDQDESADKSVSAMSERSPLEVSVDCPALPTPNSPVELVGISHHTAGLNVRGRVGFAGTSLDRVLKSMIKAGFDECLVLSTCNRTEIYFVGGCREEAERLMFEGSGLTFDELSGYLYSKSGVVAARHLFEVASGLDSAVLGETEIVAQIKGAVAAARKAGCIGKHLDFVVRKAQVASRRVRAETDLCRNVTSVGSLAVRDARRLIDGFADKTVVVVGAGKIAERIAKDLIAHRIGRIIFVNRTYANADALARRYGGEARTITRLEESVLDADVVFAATSSGKPLLDERAMEKISQSRNGRRLAIVDLGVPPNIPVRSGDKGIEMVDMDELVDRCNANSQKRLAAVPDANSILEEELAEYKVECAQRAVAPVIDHLIRYADKVREQNLAWATQKLSHLSESDLKAVSDLATRMARGFLYSPIRELKEEYSGAQTRDTVTRLFRLESGGEEDT